MPNEIRVFLVALVLRIERKRAMEDNEPVDYCKNSKSISLVGIFPHLWGRKVEETCEHVNNIETLQKLKEKNRFSSLKS